MAVEHSKGRLLAWNWNSVIHTWAILKVPSVLNFRIFSTVALWVQQTKKVTLQKAKTGQVVRRFRIFWSSLNFWLGRHRAQRDERFFRWSGEFHWSFIRRGPFLPNRSLTEGKSVSSDWRIICIPFARSHVKNTVLNPHPTVSPNNFPSKSPPTADYCSQDKLFWIFTDYCT